MISVYFHYEMNMPLNLDVRLNFIRAKTSCTEETIIHKNSHGDSKENH